MLSQNRTASAEWMALTWVVVVVADVGPPPVFDSAPLWCRNRSTLVAAMQISVVMSLPWMILAAQVASRLVDEEVAVVCNCAGAVKQVQVHLLVGKVQQAQRQLRTTLAL